MVFLPTKYITASTVRSAGGAAEIYALLKTISEQIVSPSSILSNQSLFN